MDTQFLTKITTVALLLFSAFAATSLILAFVGYNSMWMYISFWAFMALGLLYLLKRYHRENLELVENCTYKDKTIKNMQELQSRLYENIARLGEENDKLRHSENRSCTSASIASGEGSSFSNDWFSMSVTSDMVYILMCGNILVQPGNEPARWWKLRAYDTALPVPAKGYYIYIRLAHQGQDAEVRFLRKSRLVQNDTHRFIQIGIITPVQPGGKRLVECNLDDFLFKQADKSKANV